MCEERTGLSTVLRIFDVLFKLCECEFIDGEPEGDFAS